MTRRDELPDIGDLTGLFDAEMRPLLRREVTDAPDPRRIAEMDARYRERLDAMPADGIEPDGWDEELFGKYSDSRHTIPDEYKDADYQRNSPTNWNISQQDIDALDARDAQIRRNADAAWQDFHSDYPQYSAEQVEVATAATLEELSGLGISAKKALADWPEFKERLAHTLKFGSAHGYLPELMEERERAIANDDGRTASLDYGSGPRHGSALDGTQGSADKKTDDTLYIYNMQRKLGLF